MVPCFPVGLGPCGFLHSCREVPVGSSVFIQGPSHHQLGQENPLVGLSGTRVHSFFCLRSIWMWVPYPVLALRPSSQDQLNTKARIVVWDAWLDGPGHTPWRKLPLRRCPCVIVYFFFQICFKQKENTAHPEYRWHLGRRLYNRENPPTFYRILL